METKSNLSHRKVEYYAIPFFLNILGMKIIRNTINYLENILCYVRLCYIIYNICELLFLLYLIIGRREY
jgi:hypothetical protein